MLAGVQQAASLLEESVSAVNRRIAAIKVSGDVPADEWYQLENDVRDLADEAESLHSQLQALGEEDAEP